MNTSKIISLIGSIAMFSIITYAFTVGDFGAEGGQLMSMPWGIVSLVDLYTGFTLFSMWIVYREKSLPVAILWVIAMMTLGFFAGALYVFLNLQSSKGDWQKFFLGKNA